MKAKPIKIDVDLAKSKLFYDKDSGLFIWIRTGKIAGNRNKRTGYINIRVNGRLIQAHRLAWAIVNGDTLLSIDHINGNKSDNRICNLRTVTDTENQKNQKLFSNNKSGYAGVHWHKATGKWRAVIGCKGKTKHLGSFESKDDAIKCRLIAESSHLYHPNHGKR